MWKRSAALSQGQREAIGLNVRNEDGRLVMPSYDALNNFVNEADPPRLVRRAQPLARRPSRQAEQKTIVNSPSLRNS
ncbi:MAG: hypothetical protein ACJAVK_002665 [Akkermansiaceae bacterium]